MNEKTLIKKYFSNPNYANFDNLRGYTDDTQHTPDIIWVYSGRNRGKSFEISAKALKQAWLTKGAEQFAYIRRFDKDISNDKVISYFADKIEFIKDLTNGKANGVNVKTGHIFLSNTYENEKGKIVVENVLEVGRSFGLNVSSTYKSMQFPAIKEMIFEEVLAEDRGLEDEPQKLLNLISTIKRNKTDFVCWLIANTITKVNPYTTNFALKGMLKQKPNTVDTYKLYNGQIDENGNDDYFLILVNYLANGHNEKVTKKASSSSIIASTLNNKWEEFKVYPTLSQKIVNNYKSEYTAVIEYGDFCFLCEIKSVPINIQEFYINSIDNECDVELNGELMQVCFISRKTSKVIKGTRLFTTKPVVNPYSTIGFKITNEYDNLLKQLIDIGWTFYSDNLTANDFSKCLLNLKKFN